MGTERIKGQVVDIGNRRIYPAEILIEDGKIGAMTEVTSASQHFICPGFVDAHVHVESSMLPPAEFARIAMRHGTIASVSDPHEIANVLGKEGVKYMLDEASKTPFKFCFGAPSCVPASPFETTGAKFGSADVSEILSWKDIGYLSEVMNYPAVINGEPMFLEMIAAAKQLGKPVDGHAPGLRGEQARAYADAGIQTDHECFSLEEAKEKLAYGMKILIREGSAARNYEALKSLISLAPKRCMFCSDDKHPDDLLKGHINQLCARAIADGYDLFDVLQMACINPVEHYGLKNGLLRLGDPADFVILHDLRTFEVKATHIDGQRVFDGVDDLHKYHKAAAPNVFKCTARSAEDFQLEIDADAEFAHVIKALDRELITQDQVVPVAELKKWGFSENGKVINKISVVNRFKDADPSLAFITGFDLKNAAIASSVAHDSHNIVAVGSSNSLIAEAVNALIEVRGGISFSNSNGTKTLPLDIAGLMSSAPAESVAKAYSELDKLAKAAGSSLSAPYMTLSFMALLVIPDLKLSDLGLFSGKRFELMNLFV